jgi:hypothetical protein
VQLHSDADERHCAGERRDRDDFGDDLDRVYVVCNDVLELDYRERPGFRKWIRELLRGAQHHRHEPDGLDQPRGQGRLGDAGSPISASLEMAASPQDVISRLDRVSPPSVVPPAVAAPKPVWYDEDFRYSGLAGLSGPSCG